LAGPIWKDGRQVNDLWIGPAAAPEGGRPGDVTRMIRLAYLATGLFLLIAAAWRCAGWMPLWY
jgi:hypothetical protein